jgi:hypothetical protein
MTENSLTGELSLLFPSFGPDHLPPRSPFGWFGGMLRDSLEAQLQHPAMKQEDA